MFTAPTMNCTSRAFFPCRFTVLSPTFYRKRIEMLGETYSRSEWTDVIEMEKAQKQCGKDGSDLYRRDLNDSDLYKYLYNPEMKTQCQDIYIITSFYS